MMIMRVWQRSVRPEDGGCSSSILPGSTQDGRVGPIEGAAFLEREFGCTAVRQPQPRTS